jgi:hypothetical protein
MVLELNSECKTAQITKSYFENTEIAQLSQNLVTITNLYWRLLFYLQIIASKIAVLPNQNTNKK